MSQVSKRSLGNTKSRDRSRAWCLTINNWEEKDIENIKNTFEKYIIGKEGMLPKIDGTKVCLNVTRHLQVFGKNRCQVDFTKLKKLFPRAHIEKAKGNTLQNFRYCTKENDFETNIEQPLSKAELEKQFNEMLFNIYRESVDQVFRGLK